MHELGIAARIVEVAVARAAAAGPERITDVHVEIGAESSVAPGSLELYWPQVSRATSAEGARLHVSPADDPWACRVVAIDVADRAEPAGPGRPGG
jgi:Zn finger protein HypA/HybF involved in hydrogenase expression